MDKSPLIPGDIVRHTSEFLRSTGWYTGVPIDGLIVGQSGRWVLVQWHDRDEPSAVHPANLERVRK